MASSTNANIKTTVKIENCTRWHKISKTSVILYQALAFISSLLVILCMYLMSKSGDDLRDLMLAARKPWLSDSDASSFCIHCKLRLRQGEWRFIEGTEDKYGNCSKIWPNYDTLRQVASKERLGSGWNKNVYKFDNEFVLKTLNLRGAAVQHCLQTNNEAEKSAHFKMKKDCLSEAIKRFVREIRVLIDLDGDPAVPQLHAYCLPDDAQIWTDRLAVVMAGGRPIDTIYLVQKTWRYRLGLVAKIIDFIERIHPYKLNDLRRQQFVVMGDDPAYVDYDDITFDKNPYNANSKADRTARLLYDAFIKDFFWYGNPDAAKEHIDELRQFYKNETLTLAIVKDRVQRLTVINL